MGRNAVCLSRTLGGDDNKYLKYLPLFDVLLEDYTVYSSKVLTRPIDLIDLIDLIGLIDHYHLIMVRKGMTLNEVIHGLILLQLNTGSNLHSLTRSTMI